MAGGGCIGGGGGGGDNIGAAAAAVTLLRLPVLPPRLMLPLANCDTKSIGTGNMIVEFFSAAIEFKVWKDTIMSQVSPYRSCNLYAGNWS